MREIFTQNCGPDRSGAFNLYLGGDETRIVIRDSETGEDKEVWRGPKFDPEKYYAKAQAQGMSKETLAEYKDPPP